MPVVDVEVVSGEPLAPDLAARLATALAEALRERPDGTWVRVHRLDPGSYAEGDGGPPAGVRPVFVSVLRAVVPTGDVLREEARRLTETVGAVCGRPAEHVHVVYQPPGQGRVAFGGVLRD